MLSQFPGSTAREIQAQLHVWTRDYTLTRRDVNQILYGNLDDFQKDESYVPRWRVQVAPAAVQSVAPRTARVRKERERLDRSAAARTAVANPRPKREEKSAATATEWTLSLRPWQQHALRNWIAAGRRGVIEAVTGTGKTHLGLEAAIQIAQLGGQTTILVPSVELQRQWKRRITEFTHLSIATVGGEVSGNPATAHVTVALVQTAARAPIPAISPLRLLVADEVHRYGGEHWSLALSAAYSFRLGLTATLERSGDQGVAHRLLPYFGAVVFHYDYRQARAERVVAPFRLVFLGVALDADERANYSEWTRQAAVNRKKLADAGFLQGSLVQQREELNLLSAGSPYNPLTIAARQYETALRQRRTLLAECRGKIDAVSKLAQAIDNSNGSVVFSQTVAVADEAAATLRAAGVPTHAVHSQMDSRERRGNLESLEDGSIRALCAPKILDEGIDIPNIDLGIVMSASSQKRQMIQRLGRVIRLKDGGGPARFVVLYGVDTVEDPAQGAHETFIEMVREVADSEHRLDAGWTAAEATRLIDGGVEPGTWSAIRRRLGRIFG
ncbi:DEAD/DEAH box helicase [Smaragdicoccus niigatensis]|uniref:DEAD/DEAH box helicase n=1 Tax=Smaragdicoccus niigatensis TaxID=359359 RepID=UPI00035DBC64|nr:DEAD/DEAH box helicase [Smaragdicoccus niigatensis]